MKTAARSWIATLLLFVPGTVPAGEPEPLPAGVDFGAGLRLEQSTPLAEVVSSPERFAEEPLLLHGRISDVCLRKGCWTILSEGDTHLRVRFQDYGFFLPKDCSGEEAFVEGRVVVEPLSKAAARHYESESRDGNPDAVKGPRREVGFVATGVRLVGRE